MADWFLILTIVVAFVLLLVVAVYALVHYQHPDDKNDAYIPKLTIIVGFVLAGATVLLLPLDVANNEGYSGCDGYDTSFCGGLNMVLFWNIIYFAIPLFIFILIPFMTFYYEADDGMTMANTSVGANPNSRICEAIKYETAVLLIFGIIFTVLFLTLNESNVPVTQYTGLTTGIPVTVPQNIPDGYNTTFTPSLLGEPNESDVVYADAATASTSQQTLAIAVPIATFFAAVLAFFGWFFFAVFGGIGIASLPLDLILAWVRRPRHMDAVEFAEAQVTVRQRVNELVDVGELMKIAREERRIGQNGGGGGGIGKGMFNRFSKGGREERATLLEFKKAVYLLERDVDDFHDCTTNYNSHNPLLPWISLFFGCFSVLISLVWVVQIAINVLPKDPLHPFLNAYLQWFDGFFPLIGVVSVAVLSMYLLLCALKGCFKFGLNFVLFQLHPMKVGKTYMSSFMFNIALVLLCALPVVQFTSTAFEDYARYTTVSQVFGIQIQYMKFFEWFWRSKVFVYALVSVAGLTSIYLCFCKREDQSKSSIFLRDRLRAR